MRLGGKLVAMLVVLAILALPAAAVAACWNQSGSHPCLHCRTAKGQTTTAARALENPSPCCEISSSKPAPASTLQGPVVTAAIAPPVSEAAPIAVSAKTLADAPQPELLVQSTSLQAVLCVFLV